MGRGEEEKVGTLFALRFALSDTGHKTRNPEFFASGRRFSQKPIPKTIQYPDLRLYLYSITTQAMTVVTITRIL